MEFLSFLVLCFIGTFSGDPMWFIASGVFVIADNIKNLKGE